MKKDNRTLQEIFNDMELQASIFYKAIDKVTKELRTEKEKEVKILSQSRKVIWCYCDSNIVKSENLI